MSVQELVARAEALIAEAKAKLEKVETASAMQISIAVHRLELFVAELAHGDVPAATTEAEDEEEPQGTSDVDPTDRSSDPSTESDVEAGKPKSRTRARKPKSEE